MKIALIVSELNIRGGTHKQVLRLSEYLNALGHNVTIYTKYYNLKGTYPEFETLNVKSLYEGDWRKKIDSSKFLQKIKNKAHRIIDELKLVLLIDKDTDVLNFHDNGLEKVIIFSKFVFRKKSSLVWQINDISGAFHVGVHSKSEDLPSHKKTRFYNEYAAKCVDEITVNVTKNAVRVKQCLGRDAKVFYCGVDVNEALEKHSYNIKDNTVRILSSGVFFPYRNYETLIDVVENLKNKNINVHLDVIGATDRDKGYSDKIINLVKEKNLENEITIWGQVDEAKYVELHNQADMFTFININQSWGLAVFEAMSCGLPVIVSESVGAIELLHHNEDAIIVDPENVEEISDIVLKLMNDKNYYNKISENAFNAVKEFTWDKLYSERMLELFNK